MSTVDADGGVAIYCEESGNAAGVAALWLHGGPGGSLGSGWYRTHFDPARYRLIGIDQRGTGRSRPAGGLTGGMERQNTQQLIDDIEAVRGALRVDTSALADLEPFRLWQAQLVRDLVRTLPQ